MSGFFGRMFGGDTKPAEQDAPAEAMPKPSWLQRLKSGLARSSNALRRHRFHPHPKEARRGSARRSGGHAHPRRPGPATAAAIVATLRTSRYDREISDEEVKGVLAAEIAKALAPVAMPLAVDAARKPHVILVVGVNGTGKTTTIGKLAAKLRDEGKSVVLAAGDTFRAAAIEQLKIWGTRTGAEVISGAQGADAAGLAFDALTRARESGADVLIVDTAGRLQNKDGLMAELEKIIRVMRKVDPTAPHAVLLTLDATTGQNASARSRSSASAPASPGW